MPVYTYGHDIVADVYILLQLEKGDIISETLIDATVPGRIDFVDLKHDINTQAGILFKDQNAICQ